MYVCTRTYVVYVCISCQTRLKGFFFPFFFSPLFPEGDVRDEGAYICTVFPDRFVMYAGHACVWGASCFARRMYCVHMQVSGHVPT